MPERPGNSTLDLKFHHEYLNSLNVDAQLPDILGAVQPDSGHERTVLMGIVSIASTSISRLF